MFSILMNLRAGHIIRTDDTSIRRVIAAALDNFAADGEGAPCYRSFCSRCSSGGLIDNVEWVARQIIEDTCDVRDTWYLSDGDGDLMFKFEETGRTHREEGKNGTRFFTEFRVVFDRI